VSLAEITQLRAGGPTAPVTTTRASSLFSWQRGIVVLILLIWLVPTKRYRLPVNLPFKLEPYRLYILFLLGALILMALVGRMRIHGGGHGKAALLLGGAALAAQVANLHAIDAAGMQTQSLKSLSYLLSLLIAFVLVSSTLQTFGEVRAIVATIVIGAVVVAVFAFYESRFHNNVFDHLNRWFPFLQNTLEDKFNARGGRLRVRASAQHPIALAVALLMVVPLALYLARQASSKFRQRAWTAAGLVITMGAILTVSRTAVLVLVTMGITAFFLRKPKLSRLLPLLAALVLMTHVASPGALKGLYHAFTPKGGILTQQEQRAGVQGSGRLADLGPAAHRWAKHPVFGDGLGIAPTTGQPSALQSLDQATAEKTIYDDQYLTTLVSLGFVGMLGLFWFVWGAVVKLVRAARKTRGELGDLLVACAVATAGFAASMATFDAFAFVQVTLLFCVIAALGLRTRSLLEA
jgi:hypothetical protein